MGDDMGAPGTGMTTIAAGRLVQRIEENYTVEEIVRTTYRRELDEWEERDTGEERA